jgi:hypothetical protein
MIIAQRCNLRLERSDLQPGHMTLNSDTSLEGDRLYLRGSGYISAGGLRISSLITNSIFQNVYFSNSTGDTTQPASTFLFAFNTFIFTANGMEQYCDISPSGYIRDARFENNVMFAAPTTSMPNVVRGAGCTFSNNVLFPQPNTVVGNTIADPKLVDVAAKNYRVQATSPALNTAVPSTGLSTDHDFEGAARPQGAAPDIGAFERTP